MFRSLFKILSIVLVMQGSAFASQYNVNPSVQKQILAEMKSEVQKQSAFVSRTDQLISYYEECSKEKNCDGVHIDSVLFGIISILPANLAYFTLAAEVETFGITLKKALQTKACVKAPKACMAIAIGVVSAVAAGTTTLLSEEVLHSADQNPEKEIKKLKSQLQAAQKNIAQKQAVITAIENTTAESL